MAQSVPWWIRSWSFDTPPRRTWCAVGRATEGFVVAVFDHEACVATERFESLWEAQRAAMRLKCRYDPEARIEKPG